MEERKLNFSVPLLSVRRTLSSALPNEETRKTTENFTAEQKHTGSVHSSDLNLEQVTEPATVPFLWEQFPGRPKNHSGPLPLRLEGQSLIPSLPPGKKMDSVNQSFEKDEVRLMTRFRELSLTESEYVGSFTEKANKNVGSSEDEEGEVFSDAPETFSQTESFSVNCDVSGLNGSGISGLKVSETSMDLKARDFIMNRFLPAAKAMTLESPQYASRKQSVATQQPREVVIKVDRPNRKMLPLQLQSQFVPIYGQEVEEEESDDEDSLYDSDHITTKGCGFLPGLRFKNSLCMLNPVPGLKIRAQPTKSSSREARKLAKVASIKSQSEVDIKHTRNTNLVKKAPGGKQSPKSPEVKNKMISRSKGFSFSGELQTRGSSPYRRTASGNIFSTNHRAGFLGMPKLVESHINNFDKDEKSTNSFEDVTSYGRINKLSYSGSLVAEKTLYIDTVHNADSYSKNYVPATASQDVEAPERTGLGERDASESSFRSSICLGGIERQDTLLRCQDDQSKGVRLDQGHNLESSSLRCSNSPVHGNLDFYKEKISKGDGFDQKVNLGSDKSPLPPPLPRSPSESWLRRALPSVPSRNPHSHFSSQFHSRKQDSDTSLANAKWERIVKSSKFHRDHGRYSEELIEHVQERSKA